MAARGTDFDSVQTDADFLMQFLPGSGFDPLEEKYGLQSAWGSILGRKGGPQDFG